MYDKNAGNHLAQTCDWQGAPVKMVFLPPNAERARKKNFRFGPLVATSRPAWANEMTLVRLRAPRLLSGPMAGCGAVSGESCGIAVSRQVGFCLPVMSQGETQHGDSGNHDPE
jgi:hypothetical protein